MPKFMTKVFWKDTAERAVSTAAQTALLALGYSGADGEVLLNFAEVDWLLVLWAALGGALFTVLKSLAAGLKTGTASAVDAPHQYAEYPVGRSTGAHLHFDAGTED